MAWLDHIKVINTNYVLKYRECPWGDSIDATKEQLIRLGLGVSDFPVGGRSVWTVDPRGYKTEITSKYMAPGTYLARIYFPGRSVPKDEDEPFAPGVMLRREIWSDDYVGSGEALVAAGLVKPEMLPGQPGIGKVQVTLYPIRTASQFGRLQSGRPGREFAQAGRRAGGL